MVLQIAMQANHGVDIGAAAGGPGQVIFETCSGASAAASRTLATHAPFAVKTRTVIFSPHQDEGLENLHQATLFDSV